MKKNQKTMETVSCGQTFRLVAQVSNYVHGDGIAVLLWNVTEDGALEPFCDLTKNLEGFPPFSTKTAFIDTNNFDGAEELIEKYKLGKPTGRIGRSGFCTYPEYLFDTDELEKYTVEE